MGEMTLLLFILTSHCLPACSPAPAGRAQALATGGCRLWVSTTSSSVSGYDLPRDLCSAEALAWAAQRSAAAAATAQEQHSSLFTSQDGSRESLGGDATTSTTTIPCATQQQQQQQQSGGCMSPVARALSGSAGGRHVFGSSPSVRLRQSMDPGLAEEQPLVAPAVTIQGAPGVR